MNNNEDNMDWLSVSEVARIKKCSTQTIYNHIREGLYETKEFRRGSMNGILVKFPKQIND